MAGSHLTSSHSAVTYCNAMDPHKRAARRQDHNAHPVLARKRRSASPCLHHSHTSAVIYALALRRILPLPTTQTPLHSKLPLPIRLGICRCAQGTPPRDASRRRCQAVDLSGWVGIIIVVCVFAPSRALGVCALNGWLLYTLECENVCVFVCVCVNVCVLTCLREKIWTEVWYGSDHGGPRV